MSRQYYVYLLANKGGSTIYTGVTSDLQRRVYQHKEKLVPGFTAGYGVDRLVYYEVFDDPESAITREKQIKAGPRQKKIDLVNKANRPWRDLYEEL
jgi:putative endonuclease